MPVDFGILLTPGPAKGATRRWLDDLDACLPQFTDHVKSLWASDHFFWEDAPTYEAWTTMAYLAAHYPQFDIGSSVLGQSYRNPAMLAKSVATLQDLSNGRCILGIGAGWKEDEHDAYGYPFGSPKVRLEQLEDTLEIVKRLWQEPGKVTYHGKHYHVKDAYCEPKPSPVPPILVGGAGNKTIQLAARYADMWNLSDADIARYTERLTIVKKACAAINRDPASLRLTWLGRLSPGKTDAEARERAEHQGRNHYKGWKLDQAFVGTPERIVEEVKAFIDVGVNYFIFEIVGLPDPEVVQLVVDDVLPGIRNSGGRN